MLTLIRTEEELIYNYFKISPKSKYIKQIQDFMKGEYDSFVHFPIGNKASYYKNKWRMTKGVYNSISMYPATIELYGFYLLYNLFLFHKTYRIIFCPYVFKGYIAINTNPIIQKNNVLYNFFDMQGSIKRPLSLAGCCLSDPAKIEMLDRNNFFNNSITLIETKEQYQKVIDEFNLAQNEKLIKKYEKVAK